MDYQTIKVEKQGSSCEIRLNRPEVRDAFDAGLVEHIVLPNELAPAAREKAESLTRAAPGGPSRVQASVPRASRHAA